MPRGVASLLSQGCQPSKEDTPHRKNTLNTATTRRTTRKLGVSIWAEERAVPWNLSADLSRQEKKGHGPSGGDQPLTWKLHSQRSYRRNVWCQVPPTLGHTTQPKFSVGFRMLPAGRCGSEHGPIPACPPAASLPRPRIPAQTSLEMSLSAPAPPQTPRVVFLEVAAFTATTPVSLNSQQGLMGTSCIPQGPSPAQTPCLLPLALYN